LKPLVRIGSVMLALLLITVFDRASAAEAGSCSRPILGSFTRASTCGQLGWKYDPASRMFSHETRVTASDDPSGSLYVYKLRADCSANTGGVTVDALCSHAVSCPDITDASGEVLRATRWQALRARKAHAGLRQGPLLPFGEPVCVYQGQAVPMADVVAAVRQELVKQVGRPRVSVQPPGGRALVNLPVLFSAPAQHRTSLRITQPLPGAVTADPGYRWDLGDGQHATGAGHVYTPAVDPQAAGAGGYYVEGVYHRAGRQTATLTLTWQATITLGAGPGALTVPLDPITFTASGTTTTVSATNRLYSQVPPYAG
jgi:hypothetical protein